ncbi:MAG: hypothetical protein ACJASB_002940, partial [Shewanella psychromarinicola]
MKQLFTSFLIGLMSLMCAPLMANAPASVELNHPATAPKNHQVIFIVRHA